MNFFYQLFVDPFAQMAGAPDLLVQTLWEGFVGAGPYLLIALGVERIVLRPLVNQPDIILFMATFGLTYFLIGAGELMFGGSPKTMIARELYLPSGALDFKILGGAVSLQKIDIAAAIIALIMVA